MTKQSQSDSWWFRCSKGVFSFDALFSILPLVMMLSFVMSLSSSIIDHESSYTNRQEVFDKLVSIADYTVKTGLAIHEGELRYPNWLDEENPPVSYVEDLRLRSALSRLSITISDPPSENYLFCIYRLVVIGKEKTITKIYVCGD